MDRPTPRNLGHEPHYPGLPTVVFSLRFPDQEMTVHEATALCGKDFPHEISACQEWQGPDYVFSGEAERINQ